MLACSSKNNSAKKTWLLHFYSNKTMVNFLGIWVCVYFILSFSFNCTALMDLWYALRSAELNQKIHKPAPKFLSESKDLQTRPKVLI